MAPDRGHGLRSYQKSEQGKRLSADWEVTYPFLVRMTNSIGAVRSLLVWAGLSLTPALCL
jgi:hypothetical protein